MKQLCIVLTIVSMFAVGNLMAQDNDQSKKTEELKDQLSGLDETVKELASDVAGLKKIKVSGYMQINWEKSEKMNGLSTDPYDSKDFVKSRFRVRRSRLKVNYDGGSTQYVLQGDFSNAGFTLKDAYVEFNEQWAKLLSFRFGVFNCPNYEVEYSSSQRESPERSLVVRSLYPDERDLGAMVTFLPGDLFTLQLASFNSTYQGTFKQNNPNFSEFPYYYMARITKSMVFGDLGLDIGAHARFGNARANTTKVIESDSPTGKGAVVDSSLKVADGVGRNWFGVEAQLYYDFFGGMKILGEYLTGSDVNELSTAPTASTLIRKRNFSGFYVMLVKSLGTDFQFAAKYDSYTPNTKISDDKIDQVSELTTNTFGIGLHNYTFSNVRLTIWYDMISQKTNDRILAASPKQNLLTFRAQYKF